MLNAIVKSTKKVPMRHLYLTAMILLNYHDIRMWACSLFLFLYLIPAIGFAETERFSALSEMEINKIYDQSWHILSKIHIDETGLDTAIELYRKVLRLAPYDKNIHWKLSEATFKKAEIMRNDEKSLEIYKIALGYAKEAREAYPNSIEAHFWVGCCSVRIAEIINGVRALPMLSEAKSELKYTIELDTDHRFAILARAILSAIYSETPWPLRNTKKAERFAIESIDKDPNLTFARVTLAKVYLQQKKYLNAHDEAVKCLSIVEPTYIWDAELYNWPEARRLIKEIELHK